MTRTVGIGISLVVVLVVAVAAYAVYDNQKDEGPVMGTGFGGETVLDIDELIRKSDLVALGEMASSEARTKTVEDASQPVDRRGDAYSINISEISFTVDEYLKGSGEDAITITISADESNFHLHGPETAPADKLAVGTEYVVFLFDPKLMTDSDFWGDTYLTQGDQGIWHVTGDDVVRQVPPLVMSLDDLRDRVTGASE